VSPSKKTGVALAQFKLNSEVDNKCSKPQWRLNKPKQNHLAKGCELPISKFYQIEHKITEL